jgi:hypothetical protein
MSDTQYRAVEVRCQDKIECLNCHDDLEKISKSLNVSAIYPTRVQLWIVIMHLNHEIFDLKVVTNSVTGLWRKFLHLFEITFLRLVIEMSGALSYSVTADGPHADKITSTQLDFIGNIIPQIIG